jgi:hypothetical protein
MDSCVANFCKNYFLSCIPHQFLEIDESIYMGKSRWENEYTNIALVKQPVAPISPVPPLEMIDKKIPMLRKTLVSKPSFRVLFPCSLCEFQRGTIG